MDKSDIKHKFKVGDRVRCVKEFELNESIVGLEGTVVATGWEFSEGEMIYPIRYDSEVAGGHDCAGSGAWGYGWNTGEECLVIAKRLSRAESFKRKYGNV